MEWKQFTGTTLAWLDADTTVDKADASTIRKMIDKGSDNESRQVRISSTIREIARDYANAPYGQRGYALPAEGQAVMASVTEAINAMAEAFDNGGDAIKALMLPNQRSKVKHYANGASWAASALKNVNSTAVNLSKSGTWDGTHESLAATLPTGGEQ